uniref:Helicase ATP-binding domain-containing protein n=1 Tax=Magallana gigas TaxID=29159 RepID=A0A8W8NPZ9_MAGGI
MEDQVNRLNGVAGLRVEYKGNFAEGYERIKAGDVDIIFASPEALVGDPQWRSHIQKLNVGLLVIDEFHTIATWGGDETDEEEVVFRRWFRHVGEFRTLHPSATVLALSATCNRSRTGS